MTIPQFTVTAATVGALLGDSADVGDGLDSSALAGQTFQFVSNLGSKTFIPIDGGMYLVGPVDAVVHTDGVLHRVSEGVMGAAGVPLLADGDYGQVGTLQWMVKPGPVTVAGRTVRPNKWWFDARAAGVTIGLDQLPPVIGAAATGTTRGPKGDDGDPGEMTLGELQAQIAAAVAGVSPAVATHASPSKTSPANADEIPLADSGASYALKRLTWANLKSAIVAAIVDGSPATLDTLNELAAALNDDPNFAATITAAIAGKYGPGGADVALADGGTGASLFDPGADRLLFWDDSAGTLTWLSLGTNLSITGTTLNAAGGGGGGGGSVDVPVEIQIDSTFLTRIGSSYGDNPLGYRVLQPFTLTGIVYYGETADASGSTVVEVRKNGTQIAGSPKTITAANQWTYDTDVTVSNLNIAVAAGDVLRPYITSVGGTPGKGFGATLLGHVTKATY